MIGQGAAKRLAEQLARLRITLIGKSGSGKSSLVYAFCNNVFYDKYEPTEHNTLYYALLRLKGGDDPTDPYGFNTLLELEDSRGSEKSTAQEDDRSDVGKLFDPWWPLTKKEAMKEVPKDTADEVDRNYIRSVNKPWSMDHAPVARHNDEGATVKSGSLGRYYCGRRVKPSNYECGKRALTDRQLKVEKDKLYLEREKIEIKGGKKVKQKLKEIDAFIASLDDPYQCVSCSRLQHNLQPNGEFHPLTRRRMAYLFVFDCNVQESYMEALRRIEEFQEALKKKMVSAPHPLVYLVANKTDKDPQGWLEGNIRLHMIDYCREHSITQAEISALQYRGVKKLFRTIVSDIKLVQPLWKLDPLDTKQGEEGGAEKQCSVQ